ncbi:TATA-binding protein-associated factor 172 [Auxenochlorella protothecoides]|uniref:TATA-binding protein-associated factor 172 n=1 Tax=Auxenochlorella protothecoides TaxID=3075 RepID=A0A087SCC3_AUXPR|nr:TATA-binding protein-associated factor 172 [Auxenochlorella protothecoides]KFM23377.1 TATA-binding protein-associated factor 172 [Auxenochlorella protothecoides]
MGTSGATTRLDKLLNLLNCGTCPETRQEAGNQIVGILRSHPEQLPGVLGAVSALLRSPNWDTRLAAARCLGSAAMHFVHATPADIAAASGLDAVALEAELDREEPIPDGTVKAEQDGDEGPLTLENLDIQEIVDNCPPLLASGGEEYAAQAAEGVAAQRSALRKRLGLGGAAGGFMDDAELFKDEDLLAGAREPEPSAAQPEPAPIQAREGSARLRLASSRRLKGLKRAQGSATGGGLLPPRKSAKLDAGGGGGDQPQAGAPSIDPACPPAAAALRSSEAAWAAVLAGEWPLQRALAAEALRANRAWLGGCAAALLALLALDRFSDFVGDGAVGPTRETAAQALGALCPALGPAGLRALLRALCALARCDVWQARHGGVLGLRCVVAAMADALADGAGVWACEDLAAALAALGPRLVLERDPGLLGRVRRLWRRLVGDRGAAAALVPALELGWGSEEASERIQAVWALCVALPGSRVVPGQPPLAVGSAGELSAARLAAADALGSLAAAVVRRAGGEAGTTSGEAGGEATGDPSSATNDAALEAVAETLRRGLQATEGRWQTARLAAALALRAWAQGGDGRGGGAARAGGAPGRGTERLRLLAHVAVAAAQPFAAAGGAQTPLMAALRREPDPALQLVAAGGLADLVAALRRRTPSPVDKIVKNLVGFVTGDRTPDAAAPPPFPPEDEDAEAAGATEADDTGAGPAAASPAALACRGGEAALRALAFRLGDDLFPALPCLLEGQVEGPLRSLGGGAGGEESARQDPDGGEVAAARGAAAACRVVEALAPALSPGARRALLDRLALALGALRHANGAVQLAACRALAALAASDPAAVLPGLLEGLTPLLQGAALPAARAGALYALRLLGSGLGPALVPYAPLLARPLLGRMSDPLPALRALAAASFAAVVAALPLALGEGGAGGLPVPPGLSDAQRATLLAEKRFLEALLAGPAAQSCGGGGGGAGGADGAPSRMAPPPALALDLRPYQREGVAWLCFLRATGLHGVLADDMGLGKTVQATAVLALAAAEEGVAARGEGRAPRPSLVLCPATLVAHWPFEIRKALGGGGVSPVVGAQVGGSGDGQGVRSGDAQGVRSCDGQAAEPGDAKDPTTPAATPGGEPLAVLQYAGGAAERAALRPAFLDPDVARPPDVVVASYETLRADAAHLAARDWLYVVADEGHALGNAAGRVARAACALRAQHRLVLTGTPVQNGVRELWALFDFLMPGFLGTSRAFNAKYGRALQVASRQARSRGGALSSSEAGVLALEGLHRAITPFVLRRTKGQVLTDLPPKVLQDVRCTPTPLQLDAAAAQNADDGADPARSSPDPGDGADGTAAAPSRSSSSLSSLLALRKAPKLAALAELLRGAGLGAPSAEDGDGAASATPEDAGHRVLIFAQLRASLDLVEACVLAPAGIACARIDGGVDPAERFARAQRFNADPTLGVMLLTTGVGGLGLNLTAADTVVFLEHDWNPMKDMQAGICLTQTRERLIPSPPPPRMHQAMDRAHRLGQRRSVNVYRLILAGTLEEEIMSLQRFKLDVAGAVVNADNASLEGMDAGRVLDLLGDAAKASEARDGGEAAKKKKGGLAGMLAELPDVEEAVDQYAAEFSRPETD